MYNRVLSPLAITLAVASVAIIPTTAVAESRAPIPRAEIYLGSRSGDRIVNVLFDRKPESLRVTVDGREARIGARVGGINLYQPVAPKGDTSTGRSYWVLIEANSESGAKLRLHERLYLHRGFTPSKK